MSTLQDDLRFYDSISPVFGGKKFVIPPPKLNPVQRKMRRMAFRNEKNLYYRICDLTGKKILSVYHEDSSYVVYCFKEWASDKWDSMDYGKGVDFERSFFEQFDELLKAVPKKSLNINDSMENCDYCNYGFNCKNCYLTFGGFQSENCYYSRTPAMCNYDVDGIFNIECQYVYDCVSCVKCYEVFFSDYSTNCSSSAFLIDCVGVKDCFGCVGLKQKQYCFLNRQFTKEEYEKKIEGILSDRERLDDFMTRFREFSLNFPRKYARNTQAENCTGDLLRNCQNCFESFDLYNQQDTKYSELGGIQTHHVYDCTVAGMGVVNCYEQIGCKSSNKCSFGVYNHDNQDCYYMFNSNNCKDCFGCDGLKYKQYCIFNKQYSKEEYEVIVAKLIEKMIERGEWGEFFPVSISPFAYNETMAFDFFPLGKKEANEGGFRWKDGVGGTGKFQVIKQEKDFLEKFGIALPNQSPEERYKKRFKRLNPYELWKRKCADTGEEVFSPYSPDSPEVIYSAQGYLNYEFLIK